MRVRIAATTHIGHVRTRNEDSFGYSSSGAIQGDEVSSEVVVDQLPVLAVVADGMGGHPCGDLASRLVVESILKAAPVDEAALVASIVGASSDLQCRAADGDECAGMGSTVAAVLVTGDHVVIANVGDSRIYSILSGAPLTQLSTDDAPSSAPGSRPASHITQALGRTDRVSPHTASFEHVDVGRLLICSDGLSSYVPSIEISDALRIGDLRGALGSLRDAALAASGNDNFTIVLLDLA